MTSGYERRTRESYDRTAADFAAWCSAWTCRRARAPDEGRRHTVALDFHRRRPSQVADLLADAGLTVCTTTVREPDRGGDFAEDSPQAYLLATLS